MLAFFPSKDRLEIIRKIRQKFAKFITRHNWWRIEFINKEAAARAQEFAMSPQFESYNFCVASYGDDECGLWFTK